MRGKRTYRLTIPGPLIRRGFWLYVWRVNVGSKELLYVGRTGDNSSPFATPAYHRMGQHLGRVKTQNALRKHLESRGISPEKCTSFELIAHGPIFPEVSGPDGASRLSLMAKHLPVRDIVGALEKKLAESLSAAGYTVMNTVNWKPPLDGRLWRNVRSAFSEYFPKLKTLSVRKSLSRRR
jgi:hypothetical protein